MYQKGRLQNKEGGGFAELFTTDDCPFKHFPYVHCIASTQYRNIIHRNSVTDSRYRDIVISNNPLLQYSDTYCESCNLYEFRLLCSHFVCLCFDCTRLYLVKQENCSTQSCGDVIIVTSLQSFTLFVKKTLADIIILWLLKLSITIQMHNKKDIEFVTEFPCFLGHPVFYIVYYLRIMQLNVKIISPAE